MAAARRSSSARELSRKARSLLVRAAVDDDGLASDTAGPMASLRVLRRRRRSRTRDTNRSFSDRAPDRSALGYYIFAQIALPHQPGGPIRPGPPDDHSLVMPSLSARLQQPLGLSLSLSAAAHVNTPKFSPGCAISAAAAPYMHRAFPMPMSLAAACPARVNAEEPIGRNELGSVRQYEPCVMCAQSENPIALLPSLSLSVDRRSIYIRV